jgi:ribosomal protein S21
MGRIIPAHILNERCGCIMGLDVSLHDGESQDSLVRRFQRIIQMEGILREARASQTFLSKRDAANLKSRRAARRRRMGRQSFK